MDGWMDDEDEDEDEDDGQNLFENIVTNPAYFA